MFGGTGGLNFYRIIDAVAWAVTLVTEGTEISKKCLSAEVLLFSAGLESIE